MSRYAARTSVPVDRSRTVLERTLEHYGASGFGYAWDRREGAEAVLITFTITTRMVRIEIPMPTLKEAGSPARLQGLERQRWRALLLVIKAKLEAVECGISTLETEFLAGMVMRDGRTIGQAILPRLSEAVETGRLLPAAGGAR